MKTSDLTASRLIFVEWSAHLIILRDERENDLKENWLGVCDDHRNVWRKHMTITVYADETLLYTNLLSHKHNEKPCRSPSTMNMAPNQLSLICALERTVAIVFCGCCCGCYYLRLLWIYRWVFVVKYGDMDDGWINVWRDWNNRAEQSYYIDKVLYP